MLPLKTNCFIWFILDFSFWLSCVLNRKKRNKKKSSVNLV